MATTLAPEQPSFSPEITANASARIPALDGWRGIAILLVLFDHVQVTLAGDTLRPWTQTGQHGVTIFFVLSGFLITSKLLEGPLNLRRFYLRRFFRLMPAAWTYLAFLWAISLFNRKPLISIRETASCVFFYRNYLEHHRSVLVGHFWSLSMEEQFYIVWPCLLLLAGIRRARWFAIGGTVACASYRFANWNYYDRVWFNFHTQVRADALLTGCLLALLMADSRSCATVTHWSKHCMLPALAIMFFCIPRFHSLPPLYENLAIASLIARSVLHPDGALSRLLSTPTLAWIGAISYSVYIWQQLFIGFSGLTGIVLLSIGLPLCALGSYYCIELPCVRLGHRLTRSRISLVQCEPTAA